MVDYPLEVIRDRPETASYPLDAIENRVILGDALEVPGKMEAEVADCVFLDPPCLLQLSGRQLRRWKVKTMVEGVNDAWDHFASFEEYDAFIYVEGMRLRFETPVQFKEVLRSLS